MSTLVAEADAAGVPLQLIASPLDSRTNLGRLVDFYRKFGFEVVGRANPAGDPWMRREPHTQLNGMERRVSYGDEYMISHRPPADGPRLWELDDSVSMRDVTKSPQFYTAFPKMLPETMRTITQATRDPGGSVTVYRASPRKELNPGDWITLSRAYAAEHAMRDDDLRVYSYRVPAGSVRWAQDDLMEHGYFPEAAPGLDGLDGSERPPASLVRQYVEAAAKNALAARMNAPLKVQQRFYEKFMSVRTKLESGWPHIDLDAGLSEQIALWREAHPMFGPGAGW